MAKNIAKSMKDIEAKNNDVLIFNKLTGDVFQTEIRDNKGTSMMSVETNNGKKEWIEYDSNNFVKVDLFENYKNMELHQYLEFGKGSEFVEGLVKQVYDVNLRDVYNYDKYNDESYKVKANWENFAKEINDISKSIEKEFDPKNIKGNAEYVKLYSMQIYEKLSSSDFFDIAQDIYVYKAVSEQGKSVEEALKDFGVKKEGTESDEILSKYAAESAVAKTQLNALSVEIHNPEHFAQPTSKDPDKRDLWFSIIYPLAVRIIGGGFAVVGLCNYDNLKTRYPIGKTLAEYAYIKAKMDEYKYLKNEVDKLDMTLKDAQDKLDSVKKEFEPEFKQLSKELDSLSKETKNLDKEKDKLTKEKENLENKLKGETNKDKIDSLTEKINEKNEKLKEIDFKIENIKDKKENLIEKTKDATERSKLASRNAIEKNHDKKQKARIEYVKSKNEFEKEKKEFDKLLEDKKKVEVGSKEDKKLESEIDVKREKLDKADKKMLEAEDNLKKNKVEKPSEFEMKKIEQELKLEKVDKTEKSTDKPVEENIKYMRADMSKEKTVDKTEIKTENSTNETKDLSDKKTDKNEFKVREYNEKTIEVSVTSPEGKMEIISEKNLNSFSPELIKDLAAYMSEKKYYIHPNIEKTFNDAYKESCEKTNVEYNPNEKLFEEFYVFKVEIKSIEPNDENSKEKIEKITTYKAKECWSRGFVLEKTYNGKTEVFTEKNIDKMSGVEIDMLIKEAKNKDIKFSKKIAKRLENGLQKTGEHETVLEKEKETTKEEKQADSSVVDNGEKNSETKETTETKDTIEQKIDSNDISDKSTEKNIEVSENSKQELTEKIENTSKEKDDLKSKISELEQKIDRKLEKLDNTKNELEKATDSDDKKRLEKKIDNIKNDISKYEKEIEDNKSKLEKVENELKENIDKFEKTNDNVEKTIEQKNDVAEKTSAKSDIGEYIDKFLDKFGIVLGDKIKDSLLELKNGFNELENKLDNMTDKCENALESKIENNIETNIENVDSSSDESKNQENIEKTKNQENIEKTKNQEETKSTDTQEVLDTVQNTVEVQSSEVTPEEIAEIEAQERAEQERIASNPTEEELKYLEALEAQEREQYNVPESDLDVVQDTPVLTDALDVDKTLVDNSQEIVEEVNTNNMTEISDIGTEAVEMTIDETGLDEAESTVNGDRQEPVISYLKFENGYAKSGVEPTEKGAFLGHIVTNYENNQMKSIEYFNGDEKLQTINFDKIDNNGFEMSVTQGNKTDIYSNKPYSFERMPNALLDVLQTRLDVALENREISTEKYREYSFKVYNQYENNAEKVKTDILDNKELSSFEKALLLYTEANQVDDLREIPISDIQKFEGNEDFQKILDEVYKYEEEHKSEIDLTEFENVQEDNTIENVLENVEENKDNIISELEQMVESLESTDKNIDKSNESNDKSLETENSKENDKYTKLEDNTDKDFRKKIESMKGNYKGIAINFENINSRKDLFDVGKVADFAIKIEAGNPNAEILEVSPDKLQLGETKDGNNHDVFIEKGESGKFNMVGVQGAEYMFEVDKNIVDGRVKNFEGSLAEFIGNRLENAAITNIYEINQETNKYEKVNISKADDSDIAAYWSALEALIDNPEKAEKIIENSEIFEKENDTNDKTSEKDEDKYEFDSEAETFDSDELLTDDIDIDNSFDNIDGIDINNDYIDVGDEPSFDDYEPIE